MTTYWELLKDPRWQRMRLEVMQRANFQCESCGRGNVTLHVHHTYYEKGHKPWEYDNAALRVLCEECHSCIEANIQEVRKLIGKLEDFEIAHIAAYIRAYVTRYAPLDSELQLGDYHEVAAIANAYSIRTGDVEHLAVRGLVSVGALDAERRRRLAQWMAFDAVDAEEKSANTEGGAHG